MEKKITLWAARDEELDTVSFFTERPTLLNGMFCGTDGFVGRYLGDLCGDGFFAEITFENSPVEVELTIKVKG